ncbi:hypothetical protein LCGC14_0744450 [marine sediment metagenome]|uniref:Peptide deformylase n=1 Tax=marine sediment metagenome TaxID=412755 RepID=A0A0F9Q5U3_9ZZZZ
MHIITDLDFLRQPCASVPADTPIDDLVRDLFRELQERGAQGLSANQLGRQLRVFVMAMNEQPPICLVNPIIHKARGHQTFEEGCLSLPDQFYVVTRAMLVVISGENQHRQAVKLRFSGPEARTALHEYDHTGGRLIVDVGKPLTGPRRLQVRANPPSLMWGNPKVPDRNLKGDLVS